MENTEIKGLQLADLKVSNLPELQGWKEKQEALVEENPYVEVTDNKSYEAACKSRTALLKGRTELEKQDKVVASKLTSFRKEVKTETDKLIEITKPHEEKQQLEVKRYEGIKEAEKAEKDRLEQERVDVIKAKIDEFETESLALIQALTFETVSGTKDALSLLANVDFDFEEFDILFEQVKDRIESQFGSKHVDVVEKEKQRVENLRLASLAQEAQDRSDLQAKRLNELLPFNRFGADVDMATLWILSEFVYQSILKSKKDLFDADAKQKEDAQKAIDDAKAEADAKAKDVADRIFEIRKNRFAEIGFELNEAVPRFESSIGIGESGRFYDKKEVYYTDAIDFETMITEAKLYIDEAKEKKEAADKKKVLDDKKVVFDKRKQILLDLGFIYEEENDYFGIEGVFDFEGPSVESFLDSEFEEALVSIKHAIAQNRVAESKKLELANLERVGQFASDKELLSDFVDGLEFNVAIPDIENEESQLLLDSIFVKVLEFKKGLLTEIENL